MSNVTFPETILQGLGITDPSEIDLDAIAWSVGARVRYRPLDSCEARIVGSGDQAIISVNSKSGRRRQRFSIGHELGHWHHHRGRMLMCGSDEIGIGDVELHSPERMADRFASNLLMPDYLLRQVAKAHSKPTLQSVNAVADVFESSPTATAIRMVEGKYILGLLVCHGPKGRKWFTRSPDVPGRWFPRADLSAESFAFEVLFGNKADDTFPRKVGADAWFDRSDTEEFDIQEQSMRISGSEILTLLTISDERMLAEWGRADDGRRRRS